MFLVIFRLVISVLVATFVLIRKGAFDSFSKTPTEILDHQEPLTN